MRRETGSGRVRVRYQKTRCIVREQHCRLFCWYQPLILLHFWYRHGSVTYSKKKGHLNMQRMSCSLRSPNQLGALGITLVTSTVMFMRRVLVLNAFVWPPPTVQYVTWGISVCSGLLFWVTLNSLRSPLEVQLASGILSTILAWITYVLLVNQRLQYPSRQQQVSLFFHVITEALILLQVRMVVMSLDACGA